MRSVLAILILIAPCWLSFGRSGALGYVAFAEPPVAVAPSYRVIVHPQNATTGLERDFVSNAFLKKVTRWRNGEVIRPVDLPADTHTRRKFTEEVLSRSVSAVRSYWQQLIFSGRDVPPPELDTDAAVIAYVLKNPGALGYVSGAANLTGVKPVAVR